MQEQVYPLPCAVHVPQLGHEEFVHGPETVANPLHNYINVCRPASRKTALVLFLICTVCFFTSVSDSQLIAKHTLNPN